MCSGKVSSSCSTRGTHHTTFVTKPLICQELIQQYWWQTVITVMINGQDVQLNILYTHACCVIEKKSIFFFLTFWQFKVTKDAYIHILEETNSPDWSAKSHLQSFVMQHVRKKEVVVKFNFNYKCRLLPLKFNNFTLS